jgi:putative FmdB family regulatory protein
MPLYEYFCHDCDSSFEALVPLSASNESSCHCPGCGSSADRILSVVNFSGTTPANTTPASSSSSGRPDVTSLKLPPAARLCWMDDRSAARLAAYKAGRGAEYDDTVAARKEQAAQRRDASADDRSQSQHGSHSPLSDPVVFANRRKAAQAEKLRASATIKAPATEASHKDEP